MGFIKAITSLVNAFPALAKLFERLNSAIKEKNARERYDKKTTAIDDAVRAANSGVSAREGERSGEVAPASAVSRSGQGSAQFHNGGAEEVGGV